MQLSHMVYGVFITITIAATCVQSHQHDHELMPTRTRRDKSLVKREASVIIDSYPLESMIRKTPKVMVKRLSRGRYRKSKAKPKYGPPGPPRKPTKGRRPHQKKSAKKPSSRLRPGYKSRSVKPKHSRPRPPKLQYGPPKYVAPKPYKAPEPEGFGEPPAIYPPHDDLTPKPDYGEPPVDSYGAPLKPPNDIYPAAQNFLHSQFHGGNEIHDQPIWSDTIIASSNKQQVFAKPEFAMDDTGHLHNDFNDNMFTHLDTEKGKIRSSLGESNSFAARPWNHVGVFKENDDDDKVIVGGQYAEPPARYVPKFQPSAPMYGGSEEFAPPRYVDSEIPASATMSPYVNYKHSNMAFSPQNLNDAFSIVD